MIRKIFTLFLCSVFIFSSLQCVTGKMIKKQADREDYIILEDDKHTINEGTDYWGLLVAVGEYLNHPKQNRPSMLVKVEELYDTLISSNNWRAENIKKIKTEEATLKNIIKGLKWLDSVENEDDISLVFITTHGFSMKYDMPPFDEADNMDEALIPYEGFEYSTNMLWDDLLNYYLGKLESKGICVIIDSCHAGGFDDQYNIKSYEKEQTTIQWINGFLDELKGPDRVVLMSSEEDELSYGCFFTHYIIEGLQGEADENQDDIITAEEAFYYAKPKVTERISIQHPSILDLYPGELPIIGDIEARNKNIDAADKNSNEVFIHLQHILDKFLNKIFQKKQSTF